MSETTNNARVYGIDLGTTYSCISYLDDTGRPVVCQSMEGQNTVPSVVRILPDEDEPVAGYAAKSMAVLYPDNTIQFVKSKIGKVEKFQYGPEDDRRETTPIEVSAEILKKLAKDAGAITNTPVKDVVITVPAYFGQNEKAATKEAGIMAGLNVIDIVEEPTAAAFYYGCQHSKENEVICVFDLGGGTFDVTAMQLQNGSLSVITTDGDHDLGGRNWDEQLIAMVEEKFREATQFDEEFESDTLQDLQLACEEAKKQLSSTNIATIPVKADRTHKAAITITREEFDARTSTLLATAIDLTRQVFKRVEEKGLTINKIILVGGSTYMPQVKEAIVEEFGMEPELNEPNESVSKGACIYCAWKLLHSDLTPPPVEHIEEPIEGKIAPYEETTSGDKVIGKEETDDGKTVVTLIDSEGETRTITLESESFQDFEFHFVATKSFGIRALVNGEPKITNLILKDTLLPAVVTETFGTARADMRDVSIKLFQSEKYETYYEIEDGINIGNGVLTGLPAGLPKNTEFEITITLADNGLIEITGSYDGKPLDGKLEMIYEEGISQQ